MGVEELTKESGNVIVQKSPVQTYHIHDEKAALEFGIYIESMGCRVDVDVIHPRYSNQRPSFKVRVPEGTLKTSLRTGDNYHA